MQFIERAFYVVAAGVWALCLRQLLEPLSPSGSDMGKFLPLVLAPSLFLLLTVVVPSRGSIGFACRFLVVLTGALALTAISPFWIPMLLAIILSHTSTLPSLYFIGPVVLLASMLVAGATGLYFAGTKAPTPPPGMSADGGLRYLLVQGWAAASPVRDALQRLWNPPRIAVFLLVGPVVLGLIPLMGREPMVDLWGSPAGFTLLFFTGLHVVAAAGLWRYRRWAWILALLLQLGPPALAILSNPLAPSLPQWWWQQVPRLLVVALLLLPASRRAFPARASAANSVAA